MTWKPMPTRRAAVALVAALALGACGQNYSKTDADAALAERDLAPMQQAQKPANPHAGMMGAAAGAGGAVDAAAGQLGPWVLDVPAGWTSAPPSSSMRVAEYRVPVAHGGQEPATMAVFQGPMGSVEDNVRRWFGQFSGDGQRRQDESKGGFEVTFVDVAGTYDAGMAMGGGGAKEDYRMLGAIVEDGGTSFYFKLTGPRVEIDPLEDAFEGMILSLRGA